MQTPTQWRRCTSVDHDEFTAEHVLPMLYRAHELGIPATEIIVTIIEEATEPNS